MNDCEDCQVNGAGCRTHGAAVAVPVLRRLIDYAGDHEDNEAQAWASDLLDTYVDGEIAERLEYLRGELRAERISWSELAELQGLADKIDPSDVELLEAAGVAEFSQEPEKGDRS